MTSNIQRSVFSFDIGTNSIGWAVLGLDERGEPIRIIDAGVRIYSDGREPKSGTSLAEGRRVARGMSRRRDRYKRRRKAVLRTLTEFGLMPDTDAARKALVAETNDKKFDRIATDVYALRARALHEALPLFHIGRALFHLNQRRGFKSNRKTDKRDNDQGKIAAGISRLGSAIDANGAATLGEFLCKQRGSDPVARGWVRVRPTRVPGKKDKEEDGYGFYPERSFLQEEFRVIWDTQAAFHPEVLTDERREHLFRVMFFQRPLKRPTVGKCSFSPNEDRLPKAHPLFQQFRLYKEVNELEVVYRGDRHEKLTREQRDRLVGHLQTQHSAVFSALRKTAGAPQGTRFNKEKDARDKLKGDEVAAAMSDPARFGQGWLGMPLAERWAVIKMLIETEDPLDVTSWLEDHYGFDAERIDAIATASLPSGYGRLGESALTAMLDELMSGTTHDDAGRTVVLTERQAMDAIWGDNPAIERTVKNVDRLPPYQEVLGRRIPPGTGRPEDIYDIREGRITNPTVHIGLNQLRRVVNGLIARYGKPQQIALELARELKLNDDEKKARKLEIAQNTREAERRGKDLEQLGHENNGYNRVLLKLWEELDPAQPLNRLCIYCGRPIGIETLFSPEIDIDHILPWSQTLDDSQANRIVCHSTCNRQKGNHAPADVQEWHDRYDAILERASRLRKNKSWRFARDAMKKFKDEESFLARQLTDTQYLSRLAHEYLGALYDDEEPDEWGVFAKRNHIRVIPGRMTAMLRGKWGLNSILGDSAKNRNDHRHHAVDAAVVGVTTRSLLQRIATAASAREKDGLEETIEDIEAPWLNFCKDLEAAIKHIVVSHKPDHGRSPKAGKTGATAGQLHNDTAYGLLREPRRNGDTVVRRKMLLSLSEADIAHIADDELRERLSSATLGRTGAAFAAALAGFAERDEKFKGTRRVRVTEKLAVIEIKDAVGRAYKGYKGDANFRYDIWELSDGKWIAEVVTMFDAHQPGWASRVRAKNHNARWVLSLYQNDMVAYEHPKFGPTIGIVVKFGVNGQITLVPHAEAGDLKRRDALPQEVDPFKYYAPTAGGLKKIKLRQVRVDETGRVFDPGPQDRESRLARQQKAAG